MGQQKNNSVPCKENNTKEYDNCSLVFWFKKAVEKSNFLEKKIVAANTSTMKLCQCMTVSGVKKY